MTEERRVSGSLKRIILCIMILLIALKSTVFFLKEPVIIGEFSADGNIEQCNLTTIKTAVRDHYVIDKESISPTCSLFYSRYQIRGFYIHHYLSFQKPLESSESITDFSVRAFVHQYGFIGVLPAAITKLAGMIIPANIYALITCLTIFLIPLLARIGCKLGIISEEVSWVSLFVAFGIFEAVNIEQYILSPGFSFLRFLPISIICIVFIYAEKASCGQFRYQSFLNKLVLMVILMANGFISSFQVNAYVAFASCGVIIATGLAISARRYLPTLLTNYQCRKLRLFIVRFASPIAFSATVIGCLQFLVLYNITGSLFPASAKETNAVFDIFFFLMLVLLLWLVCISIYSTNGRLAFIERFHLYLMRSPIVLIVIASATYSAQFPGSPNHFLGWLAMNIIPISIAISYTLVSIKQFQSSTTQTVSWMNGRYCTAVTSIKILNRSEAISLGVRSILFIPILAMCAVVGCRFILGATRESAVVLRNSFYHTQSCDSASILRVYNFSFMDCSKLVHGFQVIGHEGKGHKSTRIFLGDTIGIYYRESLQQDDLLFPSLREIWNIKHYFVESFQRFKRKHDFIDRSFSDDKGLKYSDAAISEINYLIRSLPATNKRLSVSEASDSSILIEQSSLAHLSLAYVLAYEIWLSNDRFISNLSEVESIAKLYKLLWRFKLERALAIDT